MAEKEYIERGALIEAWERERAEATDLFDAFDFALEDVPVADVVEVKHGKWNYNPDGMDWGLGAWECSLCGCANHNLPMEENIKPLRWAGTNYCPNCGAKMDGGAE